MFIYFIPEYAEVGRGLLCASLDISCNNPLPRVAPNQIKALRAQIQRQVVLQRNEKSKKSKVLTVVGMEHFFYILY